MRKILLILVMAVLGCCAFAQTPTQIVNTPGPMYVYVGSLIMSSSNSANSQKIIVKILGGSWFSDSNGETAFYISNRGGLAVNQTSLGSNTTGKIALKAYQNGGNIDFYIVPKSDDYTSLAVTSYSYGYTLTPGYIIITTRTSLPAGTEISGSLAITPVLTTNSSGNIGIGTSDPQGYKLAVNGGIHSKSVKVDLTGWPDFVFLKDYQLPTLTAVKTYIASNKHLPDMPSAEEVHKNGLDLGEMNRLLLKKVEELTLYLIDKDEQDRRKDTTMALQQEQLKQQNRRIKSLEATIKKIQNNSK